MIGHFNVKVGEPPHLVEAEVVVAGDDLNLYIGGGQRYHIGAVALAVPRKSLASDANSASVSVLCVVGHKEDEIARQAALELAASSGCNVNVAVGMHIDQATQADIQVLFENFQKVLSKIKENLSLR